MALPLRLPTSLTLLLAASLFVSCGVSAQTLGDNLTEPGPEARLLASQVGVWDVTETVWATPDAMPVVSRGVAVRRMVGPLLEETLHPIGDMSDKAINRIDFLTFNRLEGRWNYVSMDTRAPVGIMTANSFERDPASHIQLTFLPFAVPGNGPVFPGPMLRMDEVVTINDDGTASKDQHFIMADGVGKKWLAHRYAYTRQVRPGE